MLFQGDLSLGDEPEPLPYRSRQEKWLYQARNVVNSTVDIKPYIFQETTCAKLGDIEKTQEELDLLETRIDSEKQYSLLSPLQHPKPKSYTFTIKIAEATDLKACDMNGKSDPYVTLVDQRQKQIGKTLTIFGDLNPVWNETFEITVPEACSIWLTVWDDNAYQDHVLCGRVLLPLDPRMFDDFVSRVSFILLLHERLLTLFRILGLI